MKNISKDKYKFSHALRPFSFAVALVACGAGVSLAWVEGWRNPASILLVFLGGVLLQAGVNLINDYADLSEKSALKATQADAIKRNFQIGIGCFIVAAGIGIWFVYQIGFAFFVLCIGGLAGALGYTLKPVNYKTRGLGVVLVFWLMGVLMVLGSYLALTGHWNTNVIWFSIPVSLLVSLLLLSNELRDYEADKHATIQTLVVRLGYQKGILIYKALVAAVGLSVMLLAWRFNQPWLLSGLLSFVFLPRLIDLLQADASERGPLTSGSGQMLMVFGVLYNLSLLFGFSS
ncbi:prenyltransferase [Neptunomonas sp.]|uniref:prenyltransferase n=1 Tax=Neptunomonas sp. TaxID=1971898 RepID=UPI003566F5FE